MSATPKPAEISGGAVQFDVRSELSGRTFRVFVYKPVVPPLGAGYPVFFTTDGNLHFPVAAMQMFGGAAFCYRPAIIVGIGYPTTDYGALTGPEASRFFDFTTPTDPGRLPGTVGAGKTESHFGGAELFYRFIDEELRPILARDYPIDPQDQSLFGHSLGGLFTLTTLFNHPGSFRNFIASSPSIWFAQRQVLDLEPEFSKAVRAGLATPRVRIEAGGLEQNRVAPRYGMPQSAIDNYNDFLDHCRTVDNARELADRLAGLEGRPGYGVEFELLEKEDHVTVLPRSMVNALKFALSDH